MIRTLAFQLAARLPDYRHALLRMLRAHDPDGQETAGKSAPALFGFLLAEPLRGRLRCVTRQSAGGVQILPSRMISRRSGPARRQLVEGLAGWH